MNTKQILPVLLFLVSSVFYAQGQRDKIKTLKVAFITSELALTPTEAEKFWPVFNIYEDKQFDLRFHKMRDLKDKMDKNSVDNLSDKEALAVLNQLENVDDELYQNRKKLVSSLKTIISPVKIIKLKKAEDDFNKKLLKQYRNKGPERP